MRVWVKGLGKGFGLRVWVNGLSLIVRLRVSFIVIVRNISMVYVRVKGGSYF